MIFDPHSSILVIFCKRPKLGAGKQRIAAELGKQRALEISELLLAATIQDAAVWQGQIVLSPATAEDSDWAMLLLPGATVIPQPAGTLGERLQYVDQQIRQAGGRKLLFIGTDSPALTPALLEEAAIQLESHDTVFIPARDGGVTLMGAARPWPDLTGLPWETPALGQALLSACGEEQYTVAIPSEGYDIDTVEDLKYFRGNLNDDPRSSRQAIGHWIDSNLPRQPAISVVIPVLNDLPDLDNLLTRLSMMTAIREIIVVDGGDSEECRRLCEIREAIYIEAEPCRGIQLDTGACRCTNDVLWFLHADSQPPPDATDHIHQHLGLAYDGGFFSFHFLGRRTMIKSLLEFGINLRTRFGIPYGDQGIFVRRSAYEQSGGFASTPLFEEVELIRNMRKQFRFGSTGIAIGVSPRRWERDGWLKRSLHNRYLALAYLLGIPAEKLVRQYRAGEATD